MGLSTKYGGEGGFCLTTEHDDSQSVIENEYEIRMLKAIEKK